MHKPTASGLSVIGWTLLMVGLVACGGGTATQVPTQAPASPTPVGASSQVSIDPCKVVTQNDATALFGAPSNAGFPSSDLPVFFCIYATADNTASMSLDLSYEANGAVKAEEFVTFKSISQDVPGLGDGAYYNSMISSLTVAKGPWTMTLSGHVKGVSVPLDKLKSLAQTALGRLP